MCVFSLHPTFSQILMLLLFLFVCLFLNMFKIIYSLDTCISICLWQNSFVKSDVVPKTGMLEQYIRSVQNVLSLTLIGTVLQL